RGNGPCPQVARGGGGPAGGRRPLPSLGSEMPEGRGGRRRGQRLQSKGRGPRAEAGGGWLFLGFRSRFRRRLALSLPARRRQELSRPCFQVPARGAAWPVNGSRSRYVPVGSDGVE